MKCELLTIDGSLGLFVRRRDIKSEADKRAICQFIDMLYHVNCSMTWFKNEEIDEVLEASKKKNKAYIGFKMSDEANPDIVFLGYTEKEFMGLKEIAGKAYELQNN